MSDNKKYYYMRLKDNFFEDETMVILESMPDGYLYSNILLKLYLKSVKSDGKLMFNDYIPYNPQMIATITRHSVGVVEKALKIFKDMGLIEILDDGTIYMLNIQSYIGKSSTEADRKRNYRSKIEGEKAKLGQMSRPMSQKRPPEIEKEIEKELDIEIESDIYKGDFLAKVTDIVDYLNAKADTKFKSSSKKTKSLIHARFEDGFTVDDFYTVIDKKCEEWKGTEFEKFLRPETLFGTKFEGYLNQKNNKNEDLFSQILKGETVIYDENGNDINSENAESSLSSLFPKYF